MPVAGRRRKLFRIKGKTVTKKKKTSEIGTPRTAPEPIKKTITRNLKRREEIPPNCPTGSYQQKKGKKDGES